jgi:hypothetical protein
MKQVTAVEWLFEKIRTETHTITEWEEIAIAAEAMEKEQIEDAWTDGMKSDSGHFGTAEQYYNETYKKTI